MKRFFQVPCSRAIFGYICVYWGFKCIFGLDFCQTAGVSCVISGLILLFASIKAEYFDG